MTITLTDDNKRNLHPFGHTFCLQQQQALGQLTLSQQKFGRLHYQVLENAKTTALIKHIGNYNAKLSLADDTKCDYGH